jgi:hypothetical protein
LFSCLVRFVPFSLPFVCRLRSLPLLLLPPPSPSLLSSNRPHLASPYIPSDPPSPLPQVANTLRDLANVATSPVVSLGAIVELNPSWDTLNAKFITLCDRLTRSGVADEGIQLQLEPFTYIGAIYPNTTENQGLIGLDSLSSDTGRREAVISIAEGGRLVAVGPIVLFEGGLGLLIYYPVFIKGVEEDDTLGYPRFNPACDVPICYNNATKTRW